MLRSRSWPLHRPSGCRPIWLVPVFVALTGCRINEPAAGLDGRATVRRVVDGDTIVVRIAGRNETVRLIGIDTPETKKPNHPIDCFGPEASTFTTGLLPKGTEVLLQRDVEARDDYGRLLAYVTRAADGLSVNLALAEQGYADVLSIKPNVSRAEQFRVAVRAARDARRGLWGACAGFGVPA